MCICYPADESVLDNQTKQSTVKSVWSLMSDSSPFLRLVARRVATSLLRTNQGTDASNDFLRELIGNHNFQPLVALRDQIILDHEAVGIVDEVEQAKSAQVSGRLQALGRMLQSDISAFLGSGASFESRVNQSLLQFNSEWSFSRYSRTGLSHSSSFVHDEEKFSQINVALWEQVFKCLQRLGVDTSAALNSIWGDFDPTSSPRSRHITIAEVVCGASLGGLSSEVVLNRIKDIWASNVPRNILDYPWSLATQYLIARTLPAAEVHQLIKSSLDRSRVASSGSLDLERVQRLLLCIAAEAPHEFSSDMIDASIGTFAPGYPIPEATPALRQIWVSLLCVFGSVRTWASSFEFPNRLLFSKVISASENGFEARDSRIKLAYLELADTVAAFIHSSSHPAVLCFPDFVRSCFTLQQDQNDEVKKRAILTSTKLSLFIASSAEAVERVVSSTVTALASNQSWKLRAPLLPFMQIFVFNHRFLASDAVREKILQIVKGLLSDGSPEVREASKSSFGSLLRTFDIVSDESKVQQLTKDFAALLSPLLSSKSQHTNAEAIRKGHSAALGLSALVETRPYDVPSWMPAPLDLLSRCARLPAPISDAARKTIAEFWRTHGDEFELYEHLFTTDAIQSLRNHSAASYFA
jgi:hypothetical protein